MSKLSRDSNSNIAQTGTLQGATTQTVALSTSTAESAVMGPTTTLVRLVCTAPCFIRSDVTGSAALVTDLPLLANIPEYFGVTAGQFIHAITAAGTGSLYITEV